MVVEWWKEANIPKEDFLGKGAFGYVTIHKDQVDGGTYACKIINLPYAKIHLNISLLNILNEVKLLKGLEHGNVVRYFFYEFKGPNAAEYTEDPANASIVASVNSEFFYDSDYLIIRMELCSRSLESILGDLQVEAKHFVLEELSKALCYIREVGVIHRDIKPGNILVNSGSGGRVLAVKLGDFGLGFVDDGEKVKKTRAGTLKYMSPEMIEGRGEYSFKTDVFSMGLVFMEVLLGQVCERFRLLQMRDDVGAWNNFGWGQQTSNLIQGMTCDEVNKRFGAEEVSAGVWKLIRRTHKNIEKPESVSSGSEGSEDSGGVTRTDCVWMDIRSEVENFEGRKSELRKLKESFKRFRSSVGLVKGRGEMRKKDQLHLIHGLGGNGKTELAVKFMNCFVNKKVNGVWLRGENETTLRTSIHKLADLLQLEIKDKDGRDKSAVDLLEDLNSVVERSRLPWLFVVDNVDKGHLLARQTILSLHAKSFVLVTSQCPGAVMNLGVDHPLEPLTSEDAEEFVRKAMELQESNGEVKTLCEMLGNLPLALQQAVAHINIQKRSSLDGSSYGVGHFIKEYTKSLEGQKTLLNLSHSMTKEEQTVFNTVSMALNRIRGSSKQPTEASEGYLGWFWNSLLTATGLRSPDESPAIRLLFYIAYLDPDSLPLHILQDYMAKLSSSWSPELVEQSLLELKSHSIIQSEGNSAGVRIIRVHRVVQTIMRISDQELCKSKPPYLLEICEASCSLLDSDNYSKDHLTQAVVLWNTVKEREEVLRLPGIKVMPGKIARQMLILIQYVEVLKFTEETLPLMNSVFGTTDRRVALQMKRWRGCALGHTKDLHISLQVLTETHREMVEALGEDHDDCINVADSRAMILKDNKKLEEAEAVHRSCIELCRKKSGELMGRRVAGLLSNMGMTLIELWKRDGDEGKIEEALRNYESVVEWSRGTYGQTHGYTLGALDTLAFGYSEKGDKDSLEKAKGIYKETDVINRKVLGDEHSATLVSNIYLARVLKELGEVEEAREVYGKLLEPLERVIGQQHHFYREARRELGLPPVHLEHNVLS